MKPSRKLWLMSVMVITVLALISADLVVPLTAVAAPAEAPSVTVDWASVSPMSKPRHSGATVVVDGIIYTLGGIETGGTYKYQPAGAPAGYPEVEIPIDTGTMVEAYDPASNTWTAKASLPYPPDIQAHKAEGRLYLAAAAYKGKIYTFGGADVQGVVKDTVDVYDIATDIWTAGIAKLPQPTAGISAVTYGDKIYLFGGSASAEIFAPEYYYSDVYEFDPATATFTRRAAMPNPRARTFATVSGNRILVVGGISACGNRSAQVYVPATDSWSSIEAVTWERITWGGDLVNNMIFLVGGKDDTTKETCPTVNVYSDQWQTWVKGTSMPIPRDSAFIAGVGGKVYVMGGRDKQDKAVADVIKGTVPSAPPTLDLTPPPFIPQVKMVWTKISTMPTPRYYGAAVVVDNILYTVGGLEAKSPTGRVVEAYDPVANKWTTKAPLPEGRWYLAAAVYKKKIYIFGGADMKLKATDSISVYDTETDTWKANVATLPKPSVGTAAVTYGDKIYLFGGCQGVQLFAPTPFYYNSVYAFDPETLTLVSKEPMSRARNMAFGGVVEDKIYLIGGAASAGSPANDSYNPGNNTWAKNADMPEKSGGHSGVVMKGNIYIMGGHGEGTVVEYDVTANQWESATQLEDGRSFFYTGVLIASPESIYVIGGMDKKGNVVSSVEKGTPYEGAVPPPPSPEPTPEPSPPPQPELPPAPEPTPSPPPSTGMGCAKTSSLVRESSDFSPLLLGIVWVGAALALGSRRKRNK
jgi:N-acetylneuraminic acid mutarotase